MIQAMGEALLLGVLAIASLSYFAWRVSLRLHAVWAAPGTLSVEDVPGRLVRVIKEVLFQSRVIGGRPIAGILHALVMWGFLAFAWVSIEHLSQGLVGLSAALPNHGWYAGFAAVWAALVLVGMLGLAFRRFVLRPAALGTPSFGSAAVAVLIVVLMVTYLAGWRVLEPATAAWQISWWLHTLALFAMLWVIPDSKHLHLFIGPVNVFLRTGDLTSGTRALREDAENDDDLGMVSFGDLSKKDILDLNACVECGRCMDVCPANQTGGSLNPKEVILQMQHGLLSSETNSESRVAGTAAEVDAGEAWVREGDLFECLTCGACEEACPVGIEHVGAKIVDLRRGLVSEGRTHNNKLAEMFRVMERSPHNAWGAPQTTRDKLLESAEFPIYDGSQTWLLWLGCGCSYDTHGNDVARAMSKILQAADESWGVLARETCCGDPARRAGNEYLYFELSEKVIETIIASGAKKIVTCDPHCCRTFDVDYRQTDDWAAAGIEVVHHTELLAQLTPRLSLTPEPTKPVTYHDPCYLARGRGVTAEPRSVLAAIGSELVELTKNGKATNCCGAGGAQLFIADDSGDSSQERVNHRRFGDVLESGVKTVAVACPYCAIMLDDAAGHANRKDVQIVDVAELLASRLQG
jgi:Fe-S oxidoreductase